MVFPPNIALNVADGCRLYYKLLTFLYKMSYLRELPSAEAVDVSTYNCEYDYSDYRALKR